MCSFFNTCNQCICRDCNGNIRVSNPWNCFNGCNGCGNWGVWNVCNRWNRCQICDRCNFCNTCNGFLGNATGNATSGSTGCVNGASVETPNATSGYNYGCVRVCGYNVTRSTANSSSGCFVNRCRRSTCGCGYGD